MSSALFLGSFCKLVNAASRLYQSISHYLTFIFVNNCFGNLSLS